MFGDSTSAVLSAFGLVLTALTGLVAAIFAGIATLRTGRLQQQTAEVHAAVSTPPDSATVGVAATETNDMLHEVAEQVAQVKKAVNGHDNGVTP